MTLYDLFYNSVLDFPNHTAIICGNCELTYKQLNEQINLLTDVLLAHGIKKGERVGVFYPNCVFYAALFYAALRVGAVFVPFNIRLSDAETAELVNITGCSTFIFHRSFQDRINALDSACGSIERWIAGGDDNLDESADFRKSEAAAESVPVSGDDEALIIFTGGTTCHGSAVVSTHEALVCRVVMRYRDEKRIMPDDVMLNHAPMFHTGGLSIMFQTLASGGCFLMGRKFDADDIIDECEQYGVTQLILIPPSIVYRIVKSSHIAEGKLSSVKLVVLAGGASDEETVAKVFETFKNADVYLSYGSSENSVTLSQRITRKAFAERPALIKSSGRASMMSRVKLLDDDGNEVPIGQPGEAWGKSPAQMKEYIDKDCHAVDGWLPTGDIFIRDEEGYFYFVTRKKNMIKSGGENVYAEEVEATIRKHPAVKDCVVFGLHRDKCGETVAAAVVIQPGAALSGKELISFCKANLASYKKPRTVFFISDIPTSAAGKVARGELIEIMKSRTPDYVL